MPEYHPGIFFSGWRSSTFPRLEPTDGLTDVYEFGVFGGRSMIELTHILHNSNIAIDRLIGFDSFDGIPKETEEVNLRPEWDPDTSNAWKAFNAKVLYGVNDPLDAMEHVREFVQREMIGEQELVLIPGFFETSLTPDLATKFGKAIIVDIDADIYMSSKQALAWLFENDLVDTGTYVAYDDWGGTPGYREGLDGESRAHREITEQYGVEWELVATHTDHVPDSQVVFRIR